MLLAFLSLYFIYYFSFNSKELKIKSILLFLLTVAILSCSYFWSINQDRTIEVLFATIGILLGVFLINMNTRIKIKNIDLIIGLSLIITSTIIVLDLLFDAGIRSYIAYLAGDDPTHKSGSYSRGLLVLSMLMPISVSSLLYNKRFLLAVTILALISTIILFGPNNTAKLALISSIIAFIVVYFLGPRSFITFGFIVIIWIFISPIIVNKIFPTLLNIDKKIVLTSICKDSMDYSWKILPNNKCGKEMPWKEIYFKQHEGSYFKKYPFLSIHTGQSILHRILIWEFVGKEISQNIILGNGLGTSRLIGIKETIELPNQLIVGVIPLHPHNNPLQIWLELGFIGASIYSFLWIFLISLGTKLRRQSYLIGAGSCSSIVTIFVISNLSFGVFQAWWMATIGLVLFVIIVTCKEDFSEENSNIA